MRRIPELDALRGLAVLAIAARFRAPGLAPIGRAGVDLLFVLLGFLVTCIVITYDQERGFWTGRAGVPVLALMLLAGGVAACAYGVSSWLLVTRGDGLALGALMAWGLRDAEWTARHRRWVRCTLVSIALGMLVFLTWNIGSGVLARPASTLFARHVLSAALLGLVVSHAGLPALRILRGPALGWVGRVGFAWSLFLTILARTLSGWPLLGASFGLAVLSWWWIERPIGAWRERCACATILREAPNRPPPVPGSTRLMARSTRRPRGAA